jgi:hypothetical protein
MLIQTTRTLALAAAFVLTISAQSNPEPKSEAGAVNLNVGGGWSFGLPANRAMVNNVVSPEKNTLPNLNAGFSVRAWKFLEPFFEYSYIDTGKAFAEQGSFRSEVEANTYSIHGGVRLIGQKGKIRPYAQFGYGILSQDVKGSFIVNGRSTPVSLSGSTGSAMFGGGVRMFWSKRFGSNIGFDGFRLGSEITNGSKAYSRFHAGIFFQSKTSIE